MVRSRPRLHLFLELGTQWHGGLPDVVVELGKSCQRIREIPAVPGWNLKSHLMLRFPGMDRRNFTLRISFFFAMHTKQKLKVGQRGRYSLPRGPRNHKTSVLFTVLNRHCCTNLTSSHAASGGTSLYRAILER